MGGFSRFAFVSHKLLRWVVPFLLIGLLVSNVFLLNLSYYGLIFAGQLLFYVWAALGFCPESDAARFVRPARLLPFGDERGLLGWVFPLSSRDKGGRVATRELATGVDGQQPTVVGRRNLERKRSTSRHLSVFVLIDALGWRFLEGREFLPDLLSYRKPVRTVLGFSSGAIPTILTEFRLRNRPLESFLL